VRDSHYPYHSILKFALPEATLCWFVKQAKKYPTCCELGLQSSFYHLCAICPFPQTGPETTTSSPFS
jgi:hypothetical protein